MVGGVQAHHRGQNRGYHHIHPRSTQHLAWQKILQSEVNVAHQGQERYARGKQDADGGADTELDTGRSTTPMILQRMAETTGTRPAPIHAPKP